MADRRLDVLRGGRRVRGRRDQVAARDVYVVPQPQRHRLRGPGDVHALAERVDALDDRGPAGRQDGHGLADAQDAGGDLARVAAVVGVLGGLRTDHVLHREARRAGREVVADRDGLQVLQHRRAAVPVHVGGRLHHVVTGQGRDRDRGDLRDAQVGGVRGELLGDGREDRLLVAHQVHLVDGQDHVRDAQQRGDGRVPAGLLDDAVAGVDEDHGQVGGGGAGDHVPGVLHVPGGVREDEPAARGGEVPVRDVDGDALLPLGPQAVGEQREVGGVLAALGGDGLDGFHLVGQDRLGVVQQSAHQGGLAVVDGTGGREAQQRGRCQVVEPGDLIGGAGHV